jgi:hypothetical protein
LTNKTLNNPLVSGLILTDDQLLTQSGLSLELPIINVNDSLVGTNAHQTLSNKALSNPYVS